MMIFVDDQVDTLRVVPLLDAGQGRGAPPSSLPLRGGVEVIFFRLTGNVTGGLFSVEHPMAPGTLIEPHTHEREDEYSFVTAGTLGTLLGDDESKRPRG